MKRSCALLILAAALITGCGGKDAVKPSADSLLAAEVFTHIESLKDAYLVKDGGSIRRLAGPALADSIIGTFAFDRAELAFTKRMVRITDSSVAVNVAWQGSWWGTNNRKLDNRGVADLIFGRETMKLVSIEGDSPFMMPSPEGP